MMSLPDPSAFMAWLATLPFGYYSGVIQLPLPYSFVMLSLLYAALTTLIPAFCSAFIWYQFGSGFLQFLLDVCRASVGAHDPEWSGYEQYGVIRDSVEVYSKVGERPCARG